MDGVPHVKLARAVVLVKLRDADRVTAFLEEAGASVQVRRAQLEPEDLRELGIA